MLWGICLGELTKSYPGGNNRQFFLDTQIHDENISISSGKESAVMKVLLLSKTKKG